MWKYAFFVLAAGAAIAAIAAVYWQKTGPAFADASDAALVAQGKAVYADQCASCHGVNLEGQPNWRQRRADGRLPAPPHDETGHTWHHPDAHLFQVTKYGTAAVAGPDYKTDMTAFGEILSDTEIWAVLAFIKSRWPAAIQRRHNELNRSQR
ncbi:MAG: cytochrome c [Rhodospirillaceae bacterium]|nr:cytochrome c [Rhodospirillaceae bacterium]